MITLVLLLALQIDNPPAKAISDQSVLSSSSLGCEECADCMQASTPVCAGEDGVCYLSKAPRRHEEPGDCSCCNEDSVPDDQQQQELYLPPLS